MIIYKIPISDDKENPRSYIYQTIEKRVRHLPRMGEELLILSPLFLKVQRVTYQGKWWQIVTIELAPISKTFLKELEHQSLLSKGKATWIYSKGVTYPVQRQEITE